MTSMALKSFNVNCKRFKQSTSHSLNNISSVHCICRPLRAPEAHTTDIPPQSYAVGATSTSKNMSGLRSSKSEENGMMQR